MATQTIAVPHVISFPAVQPPEKITQSELELLLALRHRAAQLDRQVTAAEISIMDRLRIGASVEDGQHSASIKESNRRSVGWKEIAERLAVRAFGQKKGKLYCARVLAATKPSTSFSFELS
jgi:hypothetical protein